MKCQLSPSPSFKRADGQTCSHLGTSGRVFCPNCLTGRCTQGNRPHVADCGDRPDCPAAYPRSLGGAALPARTGGRDLVKSRRLVPSFRDLFLKPRDCRENGMKRVTDAGKRLITEQVVFLSVALFVCLFVCYSVALTVRGKHVSLELEHLDSGSTSAERICVVGVTAIHMTFLGPQPLS